MSLCSNVLAYHSHCLLIVNCIKKSAIKPSEIHIKTWGSLLQVEFFSDFCIKIWCIKNYSCPCSVWFSFLSCWTISVDKNNLGFYLQRVSLLFSIHMIFKLNLRDSCDLLSLVVLRIKDWAWVWSSQKKAKRQREDFYNDQCTGAQEASGAKYIAFGISLPSLAANQTQPLFKWQYLLYAFLAIRQI